MHLNVASEKNSTMHTTCLPFMQQYSNRQEIFSLWTHSPWLPNFMHLFSVPTVYHNTAQVELSGVIPSNKIKRQS